MRFFNHHETLFLGWKSLAICTSLLFLGLGLRLWVSTLGYNYDVESYNIVAQHVQNSESVYAYTHRYNYGIFWACILSALKSLQNWLFVGDNIQDFHFLIAAFLSLADVAIAYLIGRNWDWKKTLFFWLNPISIALTGYHSQMENLAILWGLLGYLYLVRKPQKVALAAVLFGFSLIQKHLFIFLPIAFLFSDFWVSHWQRFKFLAICYGVFILHFAGFLADFYSLERIFQNVFFYRSELGISLIGLLSKTFVAPKLLTPLFAFAMIGLGWVFRRSRQDVFFVYLVALFFCSPSVADQYLAIPMLAVCVYAGNIWGYFYIFSGACFLYLRSPNNIGSLPFMSELYQQYFDTIFWRGLFSVYAAQVFLFFWLWRCYSGKIGKFSGAMRIFVPCAVHSFITI
jgi:hypothetical protein